MVLVDTSVWVSYFRKGNETLKALLNGGYVVCHPYIIGELACGNLKNRALILSLLQTLPMSVVAEHEEILLFIEKNKLMGREVGYVDIHLAASAILTGIPLWTFDKKLEEILRFLKISYQND